MRINIQIDVENQEDSAVAEELQSIFKDLVAQLKINASIQTSRAGASTAANKSVASAAAVAAPVATAAETKGTTPIAPAQRVATAAVPAPAAAVVQQQQQEGINSYLTLFSAILHSPPQDMQVIPASAHSFNSLIARRLATLGGDVKATATEIAEAMLKTIFPNGANAASPHSPQIKPSKVVLILSVIAPENEAVKLKARDLFVAGVLPFLTMQRSISAPKSEFFVHAECFAALCSIDLISIPGAITTISELLKNAATRAAAVTMLGKTIEMALSKLRKSDPNGLNTLRAMVFQFVVEKEFEYDLQYISQHLQAPPVAPSPVAQQQQSQQQQQTVQHKHPQLKLKTTFQQAHAEPIMSMAHHAGKKLLVSASTDGSVFSWRSDNGQLLSKFWLPDSEHYACDVDLTVDGQSLFVAGLPKPQTGSSKAPAAPEVFVYSAQQAAGTWAPVSRIAKRNLSAITVVRSVPMAQPVNFVLAETPAGSNHASVINLYDLNRVAKNPAGGQQDFLPLMTLTGHQDVITHISFMPGFPSVFVSSSRDKSIRLWDMRMQPTPVNTLVGHDGVVSSTDVVESYVLSAGLDRNIVLWDVRNPQPLVQKTQIRGDDSGVLRALFVDTEHGSFVASTINGMYTSEFGSNAVQNQVQSFKQNNDCHHCLVWSAGRSQLFAGGRGLRPMVYE